MEDIGMALEIGFSVKVKANPGNLTRDELTEILKATMEYGDFPTQENLLGFLAEQSQEDEEDRVFSLGFTKRCQGLEIENKVVHREILEC